MVAHPREADARSCGKYNVTRPDNAGCRGREGAARYPQYRRGEAPARNLKSSSAINSEYCPSGSLHGRKGRGTHGGRVSDGVQTVLGTDVQLRTTHDIHRKGRKTHTRRTQGNSRKTVTRCTQGLSTAPSNSSTVRDMLQRISAPPPCSSPCRRGRSQGSSQPLRQRCTCVRKRTIIHTRELTCTRSSSQHACRGLG